MDQRPPENRHQACRFLEEIQLALASKKLRDVEYIVSQGTAARRSIEPHGLFFNQQWHLLAWCSLRKDLHDFCADRICQLKVGTSFKTRSGLPHLATYLPGQNVREPQQYYTIRFSPDIAPKIVETKYDYGWLAESVVDAGRIEMDFSNNSVEYTGRWCMYWLPNAQAIAPMALLAFIDEQLQTKI